MAKNLFVVVTLFGAVYLLTNSPPAYGGDTVPTSKPDSTRSSGAVEMRRAPVPIVRRIVTTPRPNVPSVESNAGPGPLEPPVQDTGLAEGAAKKAVESDGYKRVTVLGQGPSGTWRVKAYRGDTEVIVKVDGTGTVTMD